MRIEITENVRNHKKNPDYPCLLTYFDPKNDPIEYSINNFGEIDEFNWMPRFNNLEKIIKKLCKLDPKFRTKIQNILNDTEKIPTLEV